MNHQNKKQEKISVIIPVKNEEENIISLLSSLKKILKKIRTKYEIIVVDGNSNDHTVEKAETLADKVLIQKNPGYGNALKEGFAISQGDYIVTMDGDLSHDPDFILLMYKYRQQAELIIASRYIYGGTAHMSLWRKFLSRILNIIFIKLLSVPIKDISSGFRMYHKNIIKGIKITSHSFDILEELAIKIWNKGYNIYEIPFYYHPRAHGQTKTKLLNFGIAYLKTLFRMWKLRNSYAAADYDDRAYNSIIPFQRYWQRRRFKIITKFLERKGEILDVGCGSNRIIRSLPNAVGLDIELSKLRYLRKSNIKLINGSLFFLPFKTKIFDEVICSEVIEHIPFDEKIFFELNKVLKMGGSLIIGTPDYGKLIWRVIEILYGIIIPGGYKDDHVTHYKFSSLSKILSKYNFQIDIFSYVLGSELIIRAKKVSDVTYSNK